MLRFNPGHVTTWLLGRIPESVLFKDAVASMKALNQSLVYSGWMEGGPDKKWIEDYIDRADKDAKRNGLPVILVRPEIKVVPFPTGWERLGPRIEIPRVCSTAPLRSLAKIGPDDDGSLANLVWFQNEFGLPGDKTRYDLRNVSWRERAKGDEF